MRILITGCKGQLGLELASQLGLEVYSELFLSDINDLDITDQGKLNQNIKSIKPDIIINCAAYTDVDGCESNELLAHRINAVGAQNLSIAANQVSAKIVQISTDYVFNGEGNVPRREYDPVSPINVYGRSKALGEALVRETNPRHYILRTAWLYGNGKNFIKTMLKLAKSNTEISVVNDQIGTPTSTKDLVRHIVALINTDSYGTYHATCEGQCSWYDFAVRIFELKEIKTLIIPITSEQLTRPAKRPLYSVLDNFMLKVRGLNSFKSWEEALEEYLRGRDEA